MKAARHFNIEITNHCNQRCLYCFNSSGVKPEISDIGLRSWGDFLRVQAGLGLRSAHFTGGEPFVSKNTIPLISEAQRLGLQTSVLSNGFRIPSLVKEFPTIFSDLAVVQLSLDGVTARLHDARRGRRGAWKDVIAAIRSLRRIRVAREISCVVSQENLNDLKRLAKFCQRTGCKLIPRPLSQIGRGQLTALRPVSNATFLEVLSEIEMLAPGVVVADRFQYVPQSKAHDQEARQRGIVTVLPNGQFRGGAVYFAHRNQAFNSVPEFLAA